MSEPYPSRQSEPFSAAVPADVAERFRADVRAALDAAEAGDPFTGFRRLARGWKLVEGSDEPWAAEMRTRYRAALELHCGVDVRATGEEPIPVDLPEDPLMAYLTACTSAADCARAGQVARGYQYLWQELDVLQWAPAGEEWEPRLVRLYEGALERYTAMWGAALVE